MSAVADGVPSTLLVWRKVRQLLPVYAAIAHSCRFAPPPCADVSAVNDGDVVRVAAWIEEIDRVSQPHHIRTVLQELDLCSSDLCVSTWLQHFISKPVRGLADRDKIDFLLTHYLRMNLPPSLQEGKPNNAAMKAVLEPVLGSCGGDLPEEAREVEELIGIAERCRTLAEFEHSGIIRRGRELKLRANEQYFTPGFLLAFTHFNAVVRRECLRLMNSDLKFIGDALDRLEQQGITHIDCTAANWSAHEPVSELKSKWATWELASKDYSQDFYANLIAFRSSVEEALERCIELSMTSVSHELRSIHELLLDMRKQIDELPRKFGQVARPPSVEVTPPPVPAKPILVKQSSPKPVQPVAVEIRPAEVLPKANDLPVAAMPSPPARSNAVPNDELSVRSEAAAAVVPMPVSGSAVAVPMRANDAIVPATPESVVVPEFPVTATAELPVVAAPMKEERAVVLEPVSQAAPVIEAQAGVDPPPIPVAPPATENSKAKQVDTPAPNTTTAPSASRAATADAPAFDLEAGIARLQKTLAGKRPSAVSIAVAGTRILLTASEASMFSLANNRYALAVQRAVMMRICLVSALETHSKTLDKSAVAPLVPAARTEQAAVRDLIAECKTQKLAREEEILSATAKQLSAMLERAERIAR